MRTLIFGDSHTLTLRAAWRRLQGTNTNGHGQVDIQPMGRGDLFPKPFFEDKGDHASIVEPGLQLSFNRLPPKVNEYAWLGFSAPFHASRIWRGDWVNHAPWPLKEPGAVVSQSVIQQIIEDDLFQTLAFIDVLRRNTGVFVIESPRPFRHHDAVTRNGPQKVMMLHNRHRQYLMAQLQLRDVPVIELDPAWLDAEGFMLPEFRSQKAGDQHHGNDTYGDLMLARVQRFLQMASPG